MTLNPRPHFLFGQSSFSLGNCAAKHVDGGRDWSKIQDSSLRIKEVRLSSGIDEANNELLHLDFPPVNTIPDPFQVDVSRIHLKG